MSNDPDLQSLCESASEDLRSMDYLSAERQLERAESLALAANDYDTLSRLYFPLQEARRQRRQRCGEGIVRWDLVASGPDDKSLDAAALATRYPQGQLLVAGYRSVGPAVELRRMYWESNAYAEVFLAAAFDLPGGGKVIAVLPNPADLSSIPPNIPVDRLHQLLPPHTVLLTPADLPPGESKGTPATFAQTMALWERLHLPHLAMADAMPISRAKLDAYRAVTDIDYACELAHQNAAQTARALLRAKTIA